jgi:NAD(P)-dependent dehydrogenase (short-subunit alcohol dehydrogenase family)
MLLKDKTAIIYGGGGAVGGAVAKAFAREGAHVFLAGRIAEKLERVAADAAALLASDYARGMTATLANVTCGAQVD